MPVLDAIPPPSMRLLAFGEGIYAFPRLTSPHVMEEWVLKVRRRSKQEVDWCFTPRTNYGLVVLFIGDRQAVVDAVEAELGRAPEEGGEWIRQGEQLTPLGRAVALTPIELLALAGEG